MELLDISAAGLLLADSGGTLRLVAASTEEARVVELFQLENDEGPAWSARTGQAVIISEIEADQATARWPQFAAAAGEMGFAGVDAIPMRLRDQVIGTPTCSRPPRAAWIRRSPSRRALIDVATIGILQERAVHGRRLSPGSCRSRWTAAS